MWPTLEAPPRREGARSAYRVLRLGFCCDNDPVSFTFATHLFPDPRMAAGAAEAIRHEGRSGDPIWTVFIGDAPVGWFFHDPSLAELMRRGRSR